MSKRAGNSWYAEQRRLNALEQAHRKCDREQSSSRYWQGIMRENAPRDNSSTLRRADKPKARLE